MGRIPKKQLHSLTEKVDEEEIQTYLSAEKAERLKNGGIDLEGV